MFALAVLHTLMPVAMFTYAALAPPGWDKWMFVYLNALALHWSVLKGECALSYAYKRHRDPEYKIGDRIDMDDERDVAVFVGRRLGVNPDRLEAIFVVMNYLAIFALVVRFWFIRRTVGYTMLIAYVIAVGVYAWVLRQSDGIRTSTNAMFVVTFAALTVCSIANALGCVADCRKS